MRLYRSLRTDELYDLLKNGIIAQCKNCNCEYCTVDKCCEITDKAHINSGTKAKLKSRYISTSESEPVVAWWSANTSGNPLEKSATYIEIDEEEQHDVDEEEKYIIKTCEKNYGAMANNRARASCEVLIMDYIPVENIISIFRVKIITKREFDKIPTSYVHNGYEFKKIYNNIQNKDKYMLTMKIWSKYENINFDINSGLFPDDYLPFNVSSTIISKPKNKRTYKNVPIKSHRPLVKSNIIRSARIQSKLRNSNHSTRRSRSKKSMSRTKKMGSK